ncbi:hypothetical protein GCM10010172_43360 [Paractinoplanes ferrugineus]|uniref:Uncharacterized protein n=1 Tax=Paractinoplanes ferrugineus TaxID=113564 RepID=A0A919J6G5_9ACTN|nr:hypothetical protein [Actinoplanes ferrugineus]GIE13494.1 hypothetical protein Afe05nite_53340 [Actinoplanes ferrugineus]
MTPAGRDAEHQEREEELERAEDCQAALVGFVDTASKPGFYQKPVEPTIRAQLLGNLDDARPVFQVLSTSNLIPFMELLNRLEGTQPITHEELLPLVNSVLRPLNLAVKRFSKRHRLAAQTGREVLTVRLTDESFADEDEQDTHPKP